MLLKVNLSNRVKYFNATILLIGLPL